jgi:hypothetical protein
MNTAIEQMLKSHNTQTLYDKKNAMKEVIQELFYVVLAVQVFSKKLLFMVEQRFGYFTDLIIFLRILTSLLLQ